MQCKKHRKYEAKKPPAVDCLACWKQYAERLEIRLEALEDELLNYIESENL